MTNQQKHAKIRAFPLTQSTPNRNRTDGLLLRRQPLYPTELSGHIQIWLRKGGSSQNGLGGSRLILLSCQCKGGEQKLTASILYHIFEKKAIAIFREERNLRRMLL